MNIYKKTIQLNSENVTSSIDRDASNISIILSDKSISGLFAGFSEALLLIT